MGKKPIAEELPQEQSLTWRLSDDGMGMLERAGLAGLYMALRAATEAGADLSPLTWRKEDLQLDSVTVRWVGPAKPAFVKLMEWAWQVQDGVLYFPAIHDARDRAQWWLRVNCHNGVVGTFLQSSKVQPRLGKESRIVELDDQRRIEAKFLSLPNSLKPHRDVLDFFENKNGAFKEKTELSTWIARGYSARYPTDGFNSNWKNKVWRGPPAQAVLRMLVPTICAYFRLLGKGNNWIFVVPDVHNLRETDEFRRRIILHNEFVDVASLGDAGLSFEAEYSTRSMRRESGAGCQVVCIGIADYFHKANAIRKSVIDVLYNTVNVRRYRILHRHLPNTFRDWPAKGPSETHAIVNDSSDDVPDVSGRFQLPTGRGRIADNLIHNRPWYSELTVPTAWDVESLERTRKRNKQLNDRDKGSRPTSHGAILFTAISRQWSSMMKLIAEDDMWDSEAEKVFVHAFWQLLDSLNSKERKATERGGSRTSKERMKHLYDEVQRALTQAKTKTLLRGVLARLFSKSRWVQPLREHPAAIWRLIDHPDHWRKGRDLALLALASHRPRKIREALLNSAKGN